MKDTNYTNKNIKKQKTNLPKINHNITYKKVRIVSDDGVIADTITINEAMNLANNRNLDLIEVSTSNAKISICKIMNYGKYKYKIKKKLSQTKKNQKSLKSSVTKEIKLRINIEQEDYNTKMRQISSFIEKNYKVKVTIKFRGREITNQQKGREILEKITTNELIKDLIKIDKQPEKQNNQISIIFSKK